jgi:enterochelin esterase family protein
LLPFTRGSDGIWSLTTPPYEPGTHVYGFVIDGVPTGARADNSVNDRLPQGYYPFEMLAVRGSEPLFHDLQPVPHGVLHIHTFRSNLFARDVSGFVYTPPGYETSGRNYPVLYLLHGAAEGPAFWTRYGYAERIMDNLIASGEAKEMIVVMPDIGAADASAQPAALAERYLLDEVIPFVERTYRVDGNPGARYLAGNSAGGMQTRNIGFLHPEVFSALGVMSGGGLAATAAPLEITYPKLAGASDFNAQVRFIYIALGDHDDSNPAIVANVQRLKDSLDRLGIHSTFTLTTGRHDWFSWRRYLAEFVKGL